MKHRFSTILAAFFLLSAPIAAQQQNEWYAVTWGDTGFDENLPQTFVSTGTSYIIVELSAQSLRWKATVKVPSAQRDVHLTNILSHANGSTHKLNTASLDEILQDPHEDGGLLTTFFLDETFIENAKAANSWTVHVGLDRYVFPMKGSRAALDHVETIGYESNHAFVQEDSDMEQALNNCAVAVAHPHDTQSAFVGVHWDDIDTSEAIPRCEWAREMMPDNAQILYLLGRAYDKAGDRRTLAALRAAADMGYAMALNHLAVIYRDNEYGTDDHSHARDLFRQAAATGNYLAQYNYGKFLAEFGNGGFDNTTAVENMEAAATADYKDAQMILARWYRDGHVAPQDGLAAQEYYQMAIETGSEVAAYELANMYRDGTGIAKNPGAYLKFLKVAARLGHEDARADLSYD